MVKRIQKSSGETGISRFSFSVSYPLPTIYLPTTYLSMYVCSTSTLDGSQFKPDVTLPCFTSISLCSDWQCDTFGPFSGPGDVANYLDSSPTRYNTCCITYEAVIGNVFLGG